MDGPNKMTDQNERESIQVEERDLPHPETLGMTSDPLGYIPQQHVIRVLRLFYVLQHIFHKSPFTVGLTVHTSFDTTTEE